MIIIIIIFFINNMNNNDINTFINTLNECYKLYIDYGSRSSKKVDYFHLYIKNQVDIYINENNKSNVYKTKLEQYVNSYNSTGKKKCDIVIYKYNEPYIIFPCKIIMSNYKQNKNNSWENLTGELLHLKWSNPGIHIIPINIFMDKTPYLNKSGIITKFENITNNDINHYEILKKNNIVYDNVNYIIEVDHLNQINEKFKQVPIIKGFNINTCFKNFSSLLSKLII